ncbi:hypothetical protein ACF0H5_004614 [Mactra antiquata]
MESCSNKFPSTDIFYEEVIFLQRTYYGDETRVRKVATILGLFPVTILTSLTSILVPTSTTLCDVIASCYLSICFYTFVTLTIDYFDGEEHMLAVLSHDKVQLNTPPCCCCCCCILRPIKMTRNALLILKTCSLQVAVVRPVLLFIAAVLWTDGKYNKGLDSSSSSYLYITILTVISTLVSMYGTVVIYRATRDHLKQYHLHLKYISFKVMLVLINLQSLIFGILAIFDIPECVGTRGTKVRASYMHHGILVIESFLLTLVARKAYRQDETEIQLTVSGCIDSEFDSPDMLSQVSSDNSTQNNDVSNMLDTDNDSNRPKVLYYDNGGVERDIVESPVTTLSSIRSQL